MKKIYALAFTLLISTFGFAQEKKEVSMDSLTKSVSGIQSQLNALKRLKVSGMVQAQFQIADSAGINSFAGGNFGTGLDKRFSVRRSRIKLQYDSEENKRGIVTSHYVIQFDITEKGLTLKDAFVTLTDPYIGWFNLAAGCFDRPFGFEIAYSSSSRESPERGRMSQILFANERDLGAMITLQAPKGSPLHMFKLNGGMFNGTGAPSAGVSISDFDQYKDFIGRFGASKSSKNNKIKWNLGLSYYKGGYRMDSVDVYQNGISATGEHGFVIKRNALENYNDGVVSMRDASNREYFGADAQISIAWMAGETALRAEYIQGIQPGTSASTNSPSSSVNSAIYYRDFNGAYFYFVQNIYKTRLQAIVKYDWYDPNTNVAGDEIGLAVDPGMKSLNASDLKFNTLGLGLAYNFDKNMRITAYWDRVSNETSSNLNKWTRDLKDNVLTLRMQCRF